MKVTTVATTEEVKKDKCDGKSEFIANKESLLNADKKNKHSIVCRRCQSLIFPPNCVIMCQGETHMLKIMSDNSAGPKEFEEISDWWITKNDLVFDTIGWQTVDGVKSLVCGDCEFGPLGIRQIISEEETTFLVAVERVKYI